MGRMTQYWSVPNLQNFRKSPPRGKSPEYIKIEKGNGNRGGGCLASK